jgi:hypothetical protein
VFIFSTGRSGSTHLQRLITLTTACWVWGEHAGFLTPLVNAARRYASDPALERFVFDVSPRGDDRLVEDMRLAHEPLAWMNRLERGDLDAAVGELIDRLFRERLPHGWTQWGFKEIRYGISDDTPRRLMELFPTARAVFSFREPESTLASMIHAWTPDLVQGGGGEERLTKIHADRVSRWRAMMEYFLTHRRAFGGRLVFVSADQLNRPAARIMEVLGLPVTRPLAAAIPPTNRWQRSGEAWSEAKLAELFAAQAAACRDLFDRAQAESNSDFGDDSAGHHAPPPFGGGSRGGGPT